MTIVRNIHIVLSVIAFAAGIIVAIIALRERVEPLTPGTLSAARQRWTKANIRNYDIKYDMHGSTYEVSVRDGLVSSARVNGRSPTGANVDMYSVDGLFDTLEQELGNAAPAAVLDQPRSTPLMRVRFHDHLGYLQRYVRSGMGSIRAISIEVSTFQVVQ